MKLLEKMTLTVIRLTSVMFALCICGLAYAQDAAAAPTYLDAIIKFITSPANAAMLAIVIEIAMRFIPTEKAKSLLVPIKYLVDGVVVILGWLSESVLDPMIKGMNKTK